jgi:stage II sporulation protein AA (anti-sigma F factor antagonist)
MPQSDQCPSNGPSDGSDGFAVTLEHDELGVRIRILGELDIATVSELDRVIGELASDGKGRLLLDLDGVKFLDSAGLAALVRAKRSAERDGGRLTVRYSSPQVRRLFELTGMLDQFPVE